MKNALFTRHLLALGQSRHFGRAVTAGRFTPTTGLPAERAVPGRVRADKEIAVGHRQWDKIAIGQNR
jgi:hypothetical protein